MAIMGIVAGIAATLNMTLTSSMRQRRAANCRRYKPRRALITDKSLAHIVHHITEGHLALGRQMTLITAPG